MSIALCETLTLPLKLPLTPLLEKTIEPCQKYNRKCNGLNGYNGNCISFNGNYYGVNWYAIDYIGGMLNPIGKNAQNKQKGIL